MRSSILIKWLPPYLMKWIVVSFLLEEHNRNNRLALIGSCRIYYVFKMKAGRFRKRYLSRNRFAKEKNLPSAIFFKTSLQKSRIERYTSVDD